MKRTKNPKFLDDFVAKFRKPTKPKHNNARRDQILRVSTDVKDITPISVNWIEAEALINENFMRRNDRQNNSPTAMEFLSFMKAWPNAEATGYAVHPDRDDYRVTLDGLKIDVTDLTKIRKTTLLHSLTMLFGESPPDEFEKTKRVWRVWWD